MLDIQASITEDGFWVTAYTEVTELKAREGEVERQHGLLDTTLATMEHGVSVFDAELRLVAWNDQFLRLFDLPPEFGHVGQRYEDFVRHCCVRGDYGPGDPEKHVAKRVARMRDPQAQRVTFQRRGVVMDIRRRLTIAPHERRLDLARVDGAPRRRGDANRRLTGLVAYWFRGPK